MSIKYQQRDGSFSEVREGINWTDAMVDRLRELKADGLSNGQIAPIIFVEFGVFVSRAAVIGKAFRLGIISRTSKGTRIKNNEPRLRHPFRNPRKVRSALVHLFNQTSDTERTEPQEPISDILEQLIPIEQRCSIMQTNRYTCKWPVGDVGASDFFYCGAQPIEGKPYCGHHCRVAYAPSGKNPRKEYYYSPNRSAA